MRQLQKWEVIALFMTEDQKIGLFALQENDFKISFFGSELGIKAEKNTSFLVLKMKDFTFFKTIPTTIYMTLKWQMLSP